MTYSGGNTWSGAGWTLVFTAPDYWELTNNDLYPGALYVNSGWTGSGSQSIGEDQPGPWPTEILVGCDIPPT